MGERPAPDDDASREAIEKEQKSIDIARKPDGPNPQEDYGRGQDPEGAEEKGGERDPGEKKD